MRFASAAPLLLATAGCLASNDVSFLVFNELVRIMTSVLDHRTLTDRTDLSYCMTPPEFRLMSRFFVVAELLKWRSSSKKAKISRGSIMNVF